MNPACGQLIEKARAGPGCRKTGATARCMRTHGQNGDAPTS